ncbi:MAG: hypothetical protein EHM40_02765 [Chloroflexi bacterium]|nr:MAG: hypothetical protein EHM40_02765 [Chloroflexota bacterium]
MNLGQLLVQSLPIVLEGKCTGGSSVTLADSSLTGKYDDDSFKDAITFIRVTTDALAPVDQYSVISAFTDSSGTFTFSPALTAVVGAGDYYAVADPIWNLYTVLRLVNQAFQKMGLISLTDVSLTGAAATLRYNLPAAVARYPIEKVEIGNNTDGWPDYTTKCEKIHPATSTGTHVLEFKDQPPYDGTTPANQTFRIWYKGYHATLDTYEDAISGTIPDPLAIEYVRSELFSYLLEKEGRISEDMMRRLQIKRGDLAQIESRNRIQSTNKPISKFLNIRDM